MNVRPMVLETAVDAATIRRLVGRLAGQIAGAFTPGSAPLAVVVLEGARRFAHDLLEEAGPGIESATISAESYSGGTASSGEVHIKKYRGPSIEGRDCLLVDDIYDTGLTLSSVSEYLRQRGAASVRTCVLLEKDRVHAEELQVDFIGSRIEDRFVVGYGLDYRGEFRALPYVAYARPAP